MLTITDAHKIYLACQAVDFRKGIDGYAAVCRRQFNLDPFSGHCFIFTNRRRTAIKVLLYDGTGFWLCHKRLSYVVPKIMCSRVLQPSPILGFYSQKST